MCVYVDHKVTIALGFEIIKVQASPILEMPQYEFTRARTILHLSIMFKDWNARTVCCVVYR